MSKEGVSVCISAYKAKDYIKECLDSVVNQSWFKTNDNWEIIVGVDGCEETLEYLKTIMHLYKHLRVFMMDSNRGTYVTSNTIISNATYDNIFRFDSDDIMCPNLVETVLKKKGFHQFVRYHMKNFGGASTTAIAWGIIFITKPLFLKYGGYKPWPCGADSDFYYRLRSLERIKTLPEILMLRRVHSTSLTQSKETGMKSDFRKKYADQIKKNIFKRADAIINCVTNTYKEIVSPLDGTANQDAYIENLNDDTKEDNIYMKHIKAFIKPKPKYATLQRKKKYERQNDGKPRHLLAKASMNKSHFWGTFLN